MDSLVLRIGTWNYIARQRPALQLFCVDSSGRTYCVNIHHISVDAYIYDREVTESDVEFLRSVFNARVRISEVNPKIALAHNSVCVDEEICSELGYRFNTTVGGDPFESFAYMIGICSELGYRFNTTVGGDPFESFAYMIGMKSDYIRINSHTQCKKKISYCEHDIFAGIEDIIGIEDQNFDHSWGDNALFYDIEVYTPHKDFVDASRMEDEITSISGVIKDGEKATSFLIVNNWRGFKKEDVRKEKLFSGKEIPHIIHETRNEEETISKFLDYIRDKRPRSIVDYNGKSFDVPYLVKRCSLLNISLNDLSMIQNIPTRMKELKVKTPYGNERMEVLDLPGVSHIDLLYYFRSYIPLLPNHQLETVTNSFLGMGKTGMTIPMFYKALEDKDRDGLRNAAEYSLRDAVALYELWNQKSTRPASHLIFSQSVKFCVKPDDMFAKNNYDCIGSLLNSIDPGFILSSEEPEAHNLNVPPKKIVKGFFHNVGCYSYSNLLLAFMQKHEVKGWNRVNEAPPGMIEDLFYHPKVSKNAAIDDFKIYIRSIDDYIIRIDKGVIKAASQINSPYFMLMGFNQLEFYPTDKSSYMVEASTMNITKRGHSLLTDTKFKLISDWVKIQLLSKIKERPFSKVYPRAENSPLDGLVMSGWIKSSNSYNSNQKAIVLKRNVALLVEAKYNKTDKNPMTKIFVEWVVSKEGPLLYPLSDNDKDKAIDYEYYNLEIKRVVDAMAKFY